MQEAYKIANFVLHHGDNMLAVENLSGFTVSMIHVVDCVFNFIVLSGWAG